LRWRVNYCVDRPQIDRQILAEKPAQNTHLNYLAKNRIRNLPQNTATYMPCLARLTVREGGHLSQWCELKR
jgi:hypothetical protein